MCETTPAKWYYNSLFQIFDFARVQWLPVFGEAGLLSISVEVSGASAI